MSSTNDAFHEALEKNNVWAKETAEKHPDLFPALAKGQKPPILWIGCADSRCPETTLLGLQPGQVFVHRNIANILHPGDLSAQSVIEYAVKYLGVEHVVLGGHVSCGGVKAALGNAKLGLIDAWLAPLRSLREQNIEALDALATEDEKASLLMELNVKKGVETLKENHHIIDAIRERGLQVYGVIYDVGTGQLRELDTNEDASRVNQRLKAFETK
ncbi:MAG: hypothetical protein M4579_002784 [Chaenotheca gracillima]|nr:MAG: hypothetical protein M4579_002784 [Chaenotheca gracillima]